jgi:predicted SAM-dependent methyltransferase
MGMSVYLGAGSDRISGFIHLDNNVSKQFKKGIKLTRPEIISDLRDPLPFLDNSVDLIYTIHTMEHLAFPDLLNCLSECNRVLKQEGIIRIVVPCFDCMISDYLSNKSVDGRPWEIDSNLPLDDHIDFFIARVMYHDHKYLHNFETLSKVLSKTGFSSISKCGPGETRQFSLQKIFLDKEINRYGDVIVEAVKLFNRPKPQEHSQQFQNRKRRGILSFLNLRIGRDRGLLPCFPEKLWFYEKFLRFEQNRKRKYFG